MPTATNTALLTSLSSVQLREQFDSIAYWIDSTDATRKAGWMLRVWDTAVREAIRAEANGTLAKLGIGGAVDANELLNVNGSTKTLRLAGGSSAPTVATGTGAGAHATASVAGTDLAGTITINTSSLDTPAASAIVATITFNTIFTSAPFVMMVAANDLAYNLAFGVVRLRNADVTTGAFVLRSGTVPLPALTTAAYLFNYIAIQ